MTSFLRTYAHAGFNLQQPFDAAVIIPTILRPVLIDALNSIFTQDFAGRIQVLLGVDAPSQDPTMLEHACKGRPPNCVVQTFYPGYSTSTRHGGLSPACDGGVLRTVLTYMANCPYIAYLDDDNWWAPNHLRTLKAAIEGVGWAYSLRWFVHPVTRQPICLDEWESVGPGRGVFQKRFGGFVDPSCLMINKLRCADTIPVWREPLLNDPKGQSADRNVFDLLRRAYRGVGTEAATVYYQLDPDDPNHVARLHWLGDRYEDAGPAAPAGSAR